MGDQARPNFLFNISDHLTQRALGAYGNTLHATPNINQLARRGVTFGSVYTPCPLCAPARASFWTDHYPHQTGVVSNGTVIKHERIPRSFPTIGHTFQKGGYRTVHFGKTHDRGGLRGFKTYLNRAINVPGTTTWPLRNETFCDRYTTTRVVKWLAKYRKKQPFFLVADLHNPHNICSWVGQNKGVHDDKPFPEPAEYRDDAPWQAVLPELPPNFEIQDLSTRPKPIQYLCCMHRRLAQAAQWSAENYRHYLAAYYHYTSRVDSEIGKILTALAQHHDEANTVVVLFADHGDGLASHRMVTKHISFYEEMTRVPLVMAGCPIRAKGALEPAPLVSLLDLFPTVCDLAGLSKPQSISPYSLNPWLQGETPDIQREYVASEWQTEWGFTVSPDRMIRTRQYKYTRYLEGNGEELYYLVADSYEQKNLAGDAAMAAVLESHRTILRGHLSSTADLFELLTVKVDPRWRSHPLGYPYHVGPSDPEAGGKK